MAFSKRAMCGIDVADYIEKRTKGRVLIGPATLYTILGKFEKEKWIKEIEVEGRKRTYRITDKGLNELNAYKVSLKKVFGEKYKEQFDELKVYIDKILEIRHIYDLHVMKWENMKEMFLSRSFQINPSMY